MSGADPAVLQQVLEAEEITGRPTVPSIWSWIVFRVSSFLEGLEASIGDVPGMGDLVLAIAALIGTTLLVLTLLAAWRLARAWRHRRDEATVAPGEAVAVVEPPDARRFREEAEAALAAGRPREAVRAAWAWVAWTLHERALARYEPDLTNREFVDAVSRAAPTWRPLPGLRSFARRVDALCYDAATPADADARALLGLADRLLQDPA